MALELVVLPCLSDNYAYLLHDAGSGETAVVDAPEPAPILAALEARGWSLARILLTHHHADHVAGAEALREATGAQILGAAADAHRLPRLDEALSEGSELRLGAESARVIEVPGHTLGHIAFHFPDSGLLFSGDSLMVMGCGRLFEGTPAQMWQSLLKLSALPPETRLCSGHEYAEANLRFALSLEARNPALMLRACTIAGIRREGRPTVPAQLSEELATNPFLRARDPEVKASVGMAGAEDASVFAALRARKDKF